MNKYRLNEKIKVINPSLTEIYQKEGEIVGYVEEIFGGWGYALQIDHDEQYWIVDENSLTSLNKFGNRKISEYLVIHNENIKNSSGMFIIRDTDRIEELKPGLSFLENIMIISLPKIYDIQHCGHFLIEEAYSKAKEAQIDCIIVDASKLQNFGYLGYGGELEELRSKFLDSSEKQFVIVGMNKEIFEINKMFCVDIRGDSPTFNSMHEAIRYLKNLNKTNH